MQAQPSSGIGQHARYLPLYMCYSCLLYHLVGAMLPLPAGDLHFYMRHSFQPYRPSEKADPPANETSPSGPHSSSADRAANLGGRSASITDRHDGSSLGGGKGLGGECGRLLLLLHVLLLSAHAEAPQAEQLKPVWVGYMRRLPSL